MSPALPPEKEKPVEEVDPELDAVAALSRRFADMDARHESGDSLMREAVNSANSAVQDLKRTKPSDSRLFKIKKSRQRPTGTE